MFTGTLLYRAENGEYPWRRALPLVILVFGVMLVAALWHVSPEARSWVAIRKGYNSLEAAGLTFAVAMLYRNKKVPRPLAWLGLVSYSEYLLHPVLIEIYDGVPWTRNESFVPTELLMTAIFLLVLLVCCGLTYRFIEAPMQRVGRRVARRLDVRFGEDIRPSGRPRRHQARHPQAGSREPVGTSAGGQARPARQAPGLDRM